MSDYTVSKLEDVPDVTGDYPGEMRFFRMTLEPEQITFTHRRMPQNTGGKGSYGHRHKTQEELYFVISGHLEFKIGDDVFEVGPGTGVRIAPQAVRSVWNSRPEDAELIIMSTTAGVDDPRDDTELVDDFWPE
jgi:mannose-6-phosphate isomerase-like protein (cupin superfamily)